MNELTKNLVNQFATNLMNRSGYDMREYEPFLSEAEKFAELIILHCAHYVDNAISDGGIDGRALIKHFGVEE